MLDIDSKIDFDSLVQALRKRFSITEGSYRELFKTSRPQKNERLLDFVWRLQHYYNPGLKNLNWLYILVACLNKFIVLSRILPEFR